MTNMEINVFNIKQDFIQNFIYVLGEVVYFTLEKNYDHYSSLK